MPILVPQSLTLLSACAAGFYAKSSDYLPKTNRIQHRDGLGLCSLIKLITFLCKNVKKRSIPLKYWNSIWLKPYHNLGFGISIWAILIKHKICCMFGIFWLLVPLCSMVEDSYAFGRSTLSLLLEVSVLLERVSELGKIWTTWPNDGNVESYALKEGTLLLYVKNISYTL